MSIKKAPWTLLIGRTLLFLAVQAVFALGFWLAGSPTPWDDGADWWLMTVIIVNLICLAALVVLYRAEGQNYWEIFSVRRANVGRDVLAMFGSLLIIGPLGYFPNVILAGRLFDNPQTVLDLILRPLPMWAVIIGIVIFPVTQGLVELPLYFTYVMPRLNRRAFPDLRPVILPALMLGLQHFALPLLFDIRFILWRGLMYIPFAFGVGILLHWRPRLLPYIAVIHVLLDMSFAMMFLQVVY